MTPLFPWFHENLIQLTKLYQQDRLPHALLISSAGGLGIDNLVTHLSRLILCHENSINQPAEGGCGHCKSCLLFKAGSHPDIKIIGPEESKKQIRVDQIRAVSQFIQKTGQQGKNKVIVIDPADQLNLQAANALLKSLEEPPSGTFLILITDRPAVLLPTIRSRCFKVPIGVPRVETQENWLKEKVPDSDVLNTLLSISEGKPCEALELFEGEGLAIREQLQSELELMFSKKLSSVEIAAKWSRLPVTLVMFWLALWSTDICRYLGSKGIAAFRDPNMGKISKFTVKNANPDSIFALTDYILESKAGFDNQANLNQQLVLEDILIKWHDIIS